MTSLDKVIVLSGQEASISLPSDVQRALCVVPGSVLLVRIQQQNGESVLVLHPEKKRNHGLMQKSNDMESDRGGCVRVRLMTFAALKDFWVDNRDRFGFACLAYYRDETRLSALDDLEWVFGNSKASVVAEALCWEGRGIKVEWREWKTFDPSDSGEITGAWALANLPVGVSESSLQNQPIDIVDKLLSNEAVTRMKQEQLFDSWKEDRSLVAIGCFDREDVDAEIGYWQCELDSGNETYGVEQLDD